MCAKGSQQQVVAMVGSLTAEAHCPDCASTDPSDSWLQCRKESILVFDCGRHASSSSYRSVCACYLSTLHGPLVDSALLVSKRGAMPADTLLTFVRPLCRPVGDPKPQALQGSRGFVVGDVKMSDVIGCAPMQHPFLSLCLWCCSFPTFAYLPPAKNSVNNASQPHSDCFWPAAQHTHVAGSQSPSIHQLYARPHTVLVMMMILVVVKC